MTESAEPVAADIAPFAAALAGRYRIEREIGAGGMATVYLAHDLKHQRQVALKVLRPELAQALGADRFLREIEIAAGLHHPHILPLFDSGEAAGRLYYVMPYVQGESLRERLARDGALPLAECSRLLAEIAEALAKAHHAGVVHRDIKPENIMLADGHALVTDFGVARALSVAGDSRVTSLGVAVGTPAYMSPEQAAADPALDHRTDIYALGLLAYEMLSGKTTFVGATPQEVLVAQIIREPEPLELYRPDVPESLAQLVASCLRKTPSERPQTMDELLPVLTSGATVTGMVAAVRRPRVPLRRRGLVIGIVAALLVVVASVGVFQMTRNSSTDTAVAAPPQSLAVLPFTTMNGDSADAYFGDGIAEEILHAVSRIPGLRVAGRTSSFRFRGASADLREIGRELGVARVLEGTVQRAGQRIRVTAQLVDASTGFSVWSEQYDREPSDIFAVQDEIAKSVASALELQFALNMRATGTQDLAAHDAYLRGLSLLDRREVSSAIVQFQRAIAADNGYVDAHAALASAFALAPEYSAISSDSAVASAETSARRALALDSNSARAHAALGYVLKNYRWDFDAAEREFKAAIALDPNDGTARHWHGELLDVLGRFDEARGEYRQALTLDPASAAAHVAMAGHFLAQRSVEGNLDSARTYTTRAAELDPQRLIYPYFLGLIALDAGDPSGARVHFAQAGATIGDSTLFLPLTNAVVQTAAATQAMAILRSWESAGPLPLVLIARWYVDVGKHQDALRVLEHAADMHAPYMTYLDYFGLNRLEGEVRYAALRVRIGLQ